jgi:hypothetical protein
MWDNETWTTTKKDQNQVQNIDMKFLWSSVVYSLLDEDTKELEILI